MPLERLRDYRSRVADPAGFDDFWSGAREEARAAGGGPVLRPAATPVTELSSKTSPSRATPASRCAPGSPGRTGRVRCPPSSSSSATTTGADARFLGDFPRSIAVTPSRPFTEIARYVATHRMPAEEVLDTLAYLDGVNFARRTSAPALYSVPASVFAAHNAHRGDDRRIAVYPYNGHEGGELHQWFRRVAWLRERLG
ncbi:MAG: acetylxylan esterase [Naasia sp.]|nr:acetylxylan esterase [Naasia sp.]